ncbi:MAG TPA: alanine racemase C-terminal domain-containing protein, partial [Corynebacterium sp.]|nr:alanine racemase C-terminal domain-containing protein [Corynebacterium sp.]
PDLYFEQVRPGLILYGMDPLPGDHGLRPAMTWSADVIVVKPIRAGEGTSYSLTWRAERDGYLAVVPCGYADGLPRRAQDRLEVGIGGRRYRQVGRVCMDQILIDLGDNPHGVVAGDEAVLFGPGGMSATELADMLDTINYEITCLPKGRTVRTYRGGSQ